MSEEELRRVRHFHTVLPGWIKEELDAFQETILNGEFAFLCIRTNMDYGFFHRISGILNDLASLDSTSNDVFTRFSGKFANRDLGAFIYGDLGLTIISGNIQPTKRQIACLYSDFAVDSRDFVEIEFAILNSETASSFFGEIHCCRKLAGSIRVSRTQRQSTLDINRLLSFTCE